MKRVLIAMVGLTLVLAATPVLAASYTYWGGITQSGNAGFVCNRYYNPVFNTVSPGGSNSCSAGNPRVGWNTANCPNACELKFFTPGTGDLTPGYQGYTEDIFNDTQVDGQNHCVVFDNLQGSGTASRAGYYFFDCAPVTSGAVSRWNTAGCTGTNPNACVGHGDTSTSTGTALSNTPVVLNPLGGLRPIPVPTVGSANKATGDIVLNWQAASAGPFNGGAPAISYDLFGVAKAACTPPTADGEFVTPLGTFTGLTTTVNVSAFGHGPADPACYYFALKLHYPNAGTTPVGSMFFSGNSQGAAFGNIGAEVTNLQAKLAGRNGVAVSWQTSMEDNLKGFIVLRSFKVDGTYEAVSDLIPAKGQPSAYTYMDTKVPVGMIRASGIFYELQTVDNSSQVQTYGPVKTDMGSKPGIGATRD